MKKTGFCRFFHARDKGLFLLIKESHYVGGPGFCARRGHSRELGGRDLCAQHPVRSCQPVHGWQHPTGEVDQLLSALGGKTQQVSKKMESCLDLSRARVSAIENAPESFEGIQLSVNQTRCKAPYSSHRRHRRWHFSAGACLAIAVSCLITPALIYHWIG